MRSIHFVLFILIPFLGNAQMNLQAVKEKAKKSMQVKSVSSLSNEDIVSGLKEALKVGIEKAGSKASSIDGFNKNENIRIPFPHEAKRMEDKLRMIGMGARVDSFELALNRAAEIASREAAPLFIQAIKNMSVNDGLTLLKGNDDAATNFLKKNTSSSLYEVFKPIVENALRKVKVTQYWTPLASRYNKIPLTTKVNPDLEDYTTKKAMEGLFTLLAQEEKKIREEPAARVSNILQKVFSE